MYCTFCRYGRRTPNVISSFRFGNLAFARSMHRMQLGIIETVLSYYGNAASPNRKEEKAHGVHASLWCNQTSITWATRLSSILVLRFQVLHWCRTAYIHICDEGFSSGPEMNSVGITPPDNTTDEIHTSP